MNRRQFLAGLTATTAAGLLVPERKVWALDRTMVRGNHIFHWVNDPLDMRVFDPVTHAFPNPWFVGDIVRTDDGRMSLITRVNGDGTYAFLTGFAGTEPMTEPVTHDNAVNFSDWWRANA